MVETIPGPAGRSLPTQKTGGAITTGRLGVIYTGGTAACNGVTRQVGMTSQRPAQYFCLHFILRDVCVPGHQRRFGPTSP